MGLKDDLSSQVSATLRSQWDVQSTSSIPDPTQLRLNSNHAKDLAEATVLYADLDGSTSMVDSRVWYFSAEIYKIYLKCAGEIIKSEDGTITAYDGDRVMAIFTGGSKNTSAVKAAMKINWAVHNILRPAIANQYPNTGSGFTLNHTVGIDSSQLRTARIGVRVDNDLVWIGRAANHAAKLSSLPSSTPLWITKTVYDNMNDEVKFKNGTAMWEKRIWTTMNNSEIYCSIWSWSID